MRAIVLSFDRNRPFVEHMIHRYQALWPENPFKFRVPFQSEEALRDSVGAIEFIPTPRAITPTVLELVRDLPDDEWVLWAIDDKYPIYLDVPVVEGILEWLPTIRDPAISGVLFCRVRKMLDESYLSGAEIVSTRGEVFLERTTYEQIWIHQFLRVKVLRHLFESMPREPIDTNGAAIMDELKAAVRLPPDHRLFVSKENHAAFGESTTRGKVTRNCSASMKKARISLPPDIQRSPDWITMGADSLVERIQRRIVSRLFRLWRHVRG